MKTVVCYKCVPDTDSLSVKRDHTLDFDNAVYAIGQYDLNAVEAAMQLSSADDSVVVITAAGDIIDNSKLKKAILARGPQAMYGIKDAALDTADTLATAKVLKAGIEKIGDVDLVLCGEGSGDVYAQQVGNVLGALLGWNTVNSVCGIEQGENFLKVERFLEDGVESLEVDYPAVISVTGDINKPRIASLKDIMSAGKKPSTVWSVAEVGTEVENVSETLSVLAPEEADRKRIVLEGNSDDALTEFASYIKSVL